MSQGACIDQILEPIVKPWLNAGEIFLLEEDRHSGHGLGKFNIVQNWKETHHL
jgi:hypothetical protein